MNDVPAAGAPSQTRQGDTGAVARSRGCRQAFSIQDGRGVVRAVDGVSLTRRARRNARHRRRSPAAARPRWRGCCSRLIEPTRGRIRFAGEDTCWRSAPPLTCAPGGATCRSCSRIPTPRSIPALSVGSIIAEPLAIHGVGVRSERRQRVAELLALVGLEADAAGAIRANSPAASASASASRGRSRWSRSWWCSTSR